MYNSELILTRNCNQRCYYCCIARGNNETQVDIDYLKYILDCGPRKLGVDMTGGEVGLIENLDEVFKTIYNHRSVKKVSLYSNGLVRKRGVDWLNKVTYYEHLIYDVYGKSILKFYEDLDFNQPGISIIVTTERTTKSLLNNFDYFKSIGLFKPEFYIKLMNEKVYDIRDYAHELLKLFNKLDDKYQIKMVLSFLSRDLYSDERVHCMLNPPFSFIDFEEKDIGHCAIQFGECLRKPFSRKNFGLLRYGALFEPNSYCQKCYNFDSGEDKEQYVLNCKRGQWMNRSYKNIHEKE
jgi:hypothetical protein